MKYKLQSYEDNFLKIEIDGNELSFEWKNESFVDPKRIEDAMNVYRIVCIKLDEAMKGDNESD